MHLHGFYFDVDHRGDEREDHLVESTSSPHLVVTERLAQGRTFALTWRPTRSGNWLFHCHDSFHLDYGGTVDASPTAPSPPQHVDNHAVEMMSGPVIGITVTGRSVEPSEHASKRRSLRLVARMDEGGTNLEPAYGYTLDDRAGASPRPPYLPGPTLVLKRGEPVSVTVVNALPESTSVHWHGIELDSYYDGVPGFSGEKNRLAPAIPPGGSFDAYFTPRRSGTFIYHAHMDDRRQQQAGLSGPLLVVDNLESYDSRHDIVVMVTAPRKAADARRVLVNGTLEPPPLELRAGDHYRLRFIDLHTSRPSMRMRLLRDQSLLTWRVIAKDGMDLPREEAAAASEVQMGNGETYDFEFVPSDSADLRLDVTAANGAPLASMPIHVW
jgi:FtsP/CotA-like multicopper oxidase with cupredoxin domain